jgi:hypothetical protein
MSPVSADIFGLFVAALDGAALTFTPETAPGLAQLANEFGFSALSARLDAYLSPAQQLRERRIAALEDRCARLEAAVSSLTSSLPRVSTSIDELETDLTSLKSWTLPLPGRLDSLIVWGVPDILPEFAPRRFVLLWRGSRDGFTGKDFHERCDGRPNTLALMRDAGGSLFGGFTPLAWDSGSPAHWKGDDSLQTFVFTLKNPHGVTERRFALKPEEKEKAIFCDANFGPCFGADGELAVRDGGRTSDFGHAFRNDTGRDGRTLLAGSETFALKEIEVFEIVP